MRDHSLKVIIFGATGMIGQGVLRECLRDPAVTQVLVIGRSPTGQHHEKLRELIHTDFLDFSAIEPDLAGYDACFYCLGVSAAGMDEQRYRQITFDYPLAAARALAAHDQKLVFVYVSGQGSDPTGRSRMRWARVKGETENALRELPMTSYLFRPGFIQPMSGVVSRTRLYRLLYAVAAPLYPILSRMFPGSLTTTEHVGRAMIAVARHGAAQPVLHNRDITTLGAPT